MLLGELLIEKNLLSQHELSEALKEQHRTHEFLGTILIRKKFVKEDDFLKVLSGTFRIPYVHLKNEDIDWNVAMHFSASLVVDHRCLPIREGDAGWVVAITNPLDASAVSQVEHEAKTQPVNLVLVSSADMDAAIRTYQKQIASKIRRLLEE